MALLPCWYLPGQFPLPSSRKTFLHKGQRADVTSEHSEQQQEKLNSTSGHINTPRQISVISLVALMCHLLLWLWSSSRLQTDNRHKAVSLRSALITRTENIFSERSEEPVQSADCHCSRLLRYQHIHSKGRLSKGCGTANQIIAESQKSVCL